MNKLKYVLESHLKSINPLRNNACPYCKSKLDSKKYLIDVKFYFTKLVECNFCKLLVRLPTDTISENNSFYQQNYKQGYTTDCPNFEELDALKKSNFENTERDYSRYITILTKLNVKSDAKILDFGCSWGYGLYQLNKAGYNALGFEISKPRLQYGIDNLNVIGYNNSTQIPNDLDVFFSSHVLEHVPDLKFVFELAFEKLKNGGIFIAITPNGSKEFQKKAPNDFHKLWGKVHPILLSKSFVEKNYKNLINIIGSLPSKLENEFYSADLDQYEFIFVLKKTL